MYRPGVDAQTAKQVFPDLAHHGIGGIEHIAHVVLDTLAEQRVRRSGIETVVGLQPTKHFGRRVLDALVEGPGVARRE